MPERGDTSKRSGALTPGEMQRMKWLPPLCLSFILCVRIVSAQTYPGNLSGYQQTGSTVTLCADSTTVGLRFYASDIVRIDFLPSRQDSIDSSPAVIRRATDSVQVTIRETESLLEVSSSQIHISCQKFPLRLSFADSAGRVLLAEPRAGGMSARDRARSLRFILQDRDHFFGTGERGTSLDKRGQAFECYNTQMPGYSTPLSTMNLNVPFVASTNGYAVYVDNVFRGWFDLGVADTSMFSYTASGGELSWYLIASPTIPGQLERYTWLTGRQPLPPRWAFGFIQSKNRYQNEREAREIVHTMRARAFPCDAIVLDLAWFERMGDLSWNESAWPHHETMLTDFLSLGIKTILITEPYIVRPSLNFDEAEAKGYLAKDSTGRTFLLDKWWSCGGCSASLLDLTNPEVQHWWWDKHPAAFGPGVAGIWTDLGEPERHPEGMKHFLGRAEEIHNVFNLLWARAIFEGFKQWRPAGRLLNITRSGFAGIQRYGVLPWSGDVARSFGGLAVQLPMLLNMGMSGLAYHHSDIGGYSRIPTTPELYVRWMQFGVFCPITRAHGAGEVVKGYPTEPWQFGPEVEGICRKYLRLRYQLLPYNYSLAYSNHESGLPLARPLFWLDPADGALLNESSSYMWGDAMLVSPVVTAGETTKGVYLPRGEWVNFWTDEVVSGGNAVSVAAPLDRIPLFVKQGSIIPMAPVMNFTDERTLDTLTLHLYPPRSGETSYTLYEDDGTTLAYQSGSFALTTFTQQRTQANGAPGLRVIAGKSRGTYEGKLQRRTYLLEVHGMAPGPFDVRCDGGAISEDDESGSRRTAGNGFSYDAGMQVLRVRVLSRADSVYTIDIRRFPAKQENR
jgi:alpha-glucosidase (family GH31 glycosyl hydrolase)